MYSRTRPLPKTIPQKQSIPQAPSQNRRSKISWRVRRGRVRRTRRSRSYSSPTPNPMARQEKRVEICS